MFLPIPPWEQPASLCLQWTVGAVGEIYGALTSLPMYFTFEVVRMD